MASQTVILSAAAVVGCIERVLADKCYLFISDVVVSLPWCF